MSAIKTIITDIMKRKPAPPEPCESPYAPTHPDQVGKTVINADFRQSGDVRTPLTDGERAIAGVLFTVSRKPQGELFTLHLGRNVIGSAEDCDIRLLEESVSPHHALILVRNIQPEGAEMQFMAAISDMGSEYGTMVGDTEADERNVPLRDHDIVKIGLHYQLITALFDTSKCGLKTINTFKPVEVPPPPTPAPSAPQTEMQYPTSIGGEDEISFYAPSRKRKNYGYPPPGNITN